MKKNPLTTFFKRGKGKKILLTMKLTILLLIAGLVQVSAISYSQATKLSLEMRNTQVAEVLREIETLSDFRFFYQREQVDVERMVNVNIKDMTIDQILELLFPEENIEHKIFADKLILIAPRHILAQASERSLQPRVITGTVTDQNGDPMIGVTVIVKGTTQGTITDSQGNFSMANVPEGGVLVFSFVGMKMQEIAVGNQTVVDVMMEIDAIGIEEVVAIGYGTQKRSDITGSVASIGRDRLDMAPNLTVGQVIQGAASGIIMRTTATGAVASEEIIIRGRNSILASNEPLIVVDGIAYYGRLSDLNANDIESIEILKDASSAAIYGSRGANGVILITTKMGRNVKPVISYDAYYSLLSYIKVPDVYTAEEFYNWKMERAPEFMTDTERNNYLAGQVGNTWPDLSLRKGSSTDHVLSVSGGGENTQYYYAGGVTQVEGLVINDDYLRFTSRVNLDSKITDWLTVGTRTQLSYDDRGGLDPSGVGSSTIFRANPLGIVYDEDGNYPVYFFPEQQQLVHPLHCLLAHNTDESYQVITNNYLSMDIPFISGLSYRLNTGLIFRFRESDTFYGTNTRSGIDGGYALTERHRYNASVIENIVDYARDIGKHKITFTGVYSFESDLKKEANVSLQNFPNDFLTFYSADQAAIRNPSYNYIKTILISQMARLNYSYDSRYLLTLTGRRDGFSGFGSQTKWGMFPSAALGWNVARENFFPWRSIINELKPRISYGLNGNQAVGAYNTIARLSTADFIDGTNTLPGYLPSTLGMDDLGWESSISFNVGVDFAVLENRITGDINYYNTKTSDLLLERSISAVHGLSSIIQNIGKTANKGLELSLNSRNVVTENFRWISSGNISWGKNEIISLYGEFDDEGNEIDDIANKWFIGQPIKVNFDYVYGGIWQLNEADEAASYNTQPGFIKIKEMTGDGSITPDDRQIIGQRDPKIWWGMNNTFMYKNVSLSFFLHGMHGVTQLNDLAIMTLVGNDVRNNDVKRDFWTPENPGATYPANVHLSERQDGIIVSIYEDASFIRIKDISLSYEVGSKLKESIGVSKARIYCTARNAFTITNWTGIDPELESQWQIPMQREIVFGLNIGF